MNLTVVTAAWRVDGVKKVIGCLNNQTYQDFEHIIVNDNNTDVRKWLNENYFFENENRRHIIDSHVRLHYYGALARNIGIQVAFSYLHHSKRDIENEWVCFLDDDNLWKTNHLQSMIDALKTNPEATMITSDAEWIGVNDPNWREIKECKFRHGGCDLGQFLYKTKLFKTYGYFDPHPHNKQRFDWRLIEKIVKGEGLDKIVLTHQSTFLMSYRKR